MRKIKKAFSLIELSVVILIVSIVLAGTLSVRNSQDVANKTKITNERIAAIYKAMGVFLLENYRLPCPGLVTNAITDATYGDENRSSQDCDTSGTYTSGNIIYGMVPTKALGLPSEMAADAWGGRFSYLVDDR